MLLPPGLLWFCVLAQEHHQVEDTVITSWEENVFLSFDEEVERRQVIGRLTTWIGDIFFLTMTFKKL